MYKKIFINQCGYLPEMEKKVTFQADVPVEFKILKSDGSCVLEGKTEQKITNATAGEINYIGDFSSVTEPGRYYVIADGLGESDIFMIDDAVYQDVFAKAMDFFYLQRCGCDLDENFSGLFAHKACHTSDAIVYGSDESREVSGGWHDAGDYGRYIVPGAMAVAQLLLAYEANETLAAAYHAPVYYQTEGTMPAYLVELKYELDWMMKMQREDGALYHKLTCYHFCGFIMPEEEKDELIISPVSVTATANFAAVTAMAVRFYKKYDAVYAATLENASKRAYAALKNIDLPGGFRNPQEITTGEYEDACDKDECYWAAAELYKAFGDDIYRQDFEQLASQKIYHGYGWRDMGTYGNLAYLSTEYPISEELQERIRKSMIELAEQKYKTVSEDGYGTALLANEYAWGSNLDTANHGLHLYDAYVLTGDKKYLMAAAEQIHYLLGRNPMGLCYLTGCGTDAIKRPHHRPSGFLGKAMPGMLSGGPCDWLADEVVKGLFTKETPPAKCIADMTGSYSTNEVTIYWNSAFIQLLLSVWGKMA